MDSSCVIEPFLFHLPSRRTLKESGTVQQQVGQHKNHGDNKTLRTNNIAYDDLFFTKKNFFTKSPQLALGITGMLITKQIWLLLPYNHVSL